ncbi:hypothetical protein IP84_00745 [beta proteobacterium AAP99]|nr:hypothetical protein IP84_00745 [beta proteobacterium AAP99]
MDTKSLPLTRSGLTTPAVARAFGCDPKTIVAMADRGEIAAPIGRDGRGLRWSEASLTIRRAAAQAEAGK